MLLKRENTRRLLFAKTLNNSFTLIDFLFFFKIAQSRFEFKVTVHHGLWKKVPSYDPSNDLPFPSCFTRVRAH